MSSKCARCTHEGKPDYFAHDRICAFTYGVFDSNNWNCVTANRLREIACKGETAWQNDQNAAVFPSGLDDLGFIILAWYKRRGRTEYAAVLEELTTIPLTLEYAEAVIKAYESRT